MRIASAQINVVHGSANLNIGRVIRNMEALAGTGTQFVMFPECALTGYGARDADEARRLAIIPEELSPIADAACNFKIGVLVGALIKEGDNLFNVAYLFLPNGQSHEYRKTHLPFMGVDRFSTPGDKLKAVDTPWGRVGVLICFDLRFPEPARTLALQGADLILVPTNWPQGAEISADHITLARAAENRVFVATCNRVGDEMGFHFIGRSKIVGLDGAILAEAGDGEAILHADLDLTLAREKRRIVIPGEYETDAFARRPELYAS